VSDKTIVLAVTVKENDQLLELMKMFHSIMYSINHDPSIDALWMSTGIGDGKHADLKTYTFIGNLLPEELRYDDETMNKVREALKVHTPLGPDDVNEVINAIQNAGILFRERLPEDE